MGVSRMLAAKASLACRVDALGEMSSTDLGIEHRAKVESRIRQLESGNITRISGTAKQAAKHDKYDAKSEVVEYKSAADVTVGQKRSADQDEEEKPAAKKIKVEDVVAESEEKKKKNKKEATEAEAVEAAEAEVKEEAAEGMEVAEVKEEGDTETPKKKKKKSSTADADASAVADSTMEADTIADA